MIIDLILFHKKFCLSSNPYNSVKESLNLDIPLVIHQEHMITNYNICNYYDDKEVEYAYLSSDIATEEILEMWEEMYVIIDVESIDVIWTDVIIEEWTEEITEMWEEKRK